MFVNQSPLPQDQLDLDFRPTPGTLVTVCHTAEEVTPLALPVSYEEARDDPIEDDEQFLLQRTVNSVGQLQVEVNSAYLAVLKNVFNASRMGTSYLTMTVGSDISSNKATVKELQVLDLRSYSKCLLNVGLGVSCRCTSNHAKSCETTLTAQS